MSQQINLFNPLFLKQKKYFSAKTMVQGLGIILSASLAFQGILLFQSQRLERQKIETQALHQQVQQQMLQVSGTGARTRSKLLEDEISRVEGMIKAQQDVMSTLEGGNLGNSQGYSRFLVALARQRTSGLWLTGFTVSGIGEELSIRGRVLRADLVPQYIRQLNRETVMRGHVVAELSMTRVEALPAAATKSPLSSASPLPEHYVEFALIIGKGGDKPERP
jgi:HAMP domain-containing protein